MATGGLNSHTYTEPLESPVLEGAHDRLQEVLARQLGKAMLVYVARSSPAPAGMRGADHWDFIEEFKKAESTLNFSPTKELFASITALTKSACMRFRKKDWSECSPSLVATTAGGACFIPSDRLEHPKNAVKCLRIHGRILTCLRSSYYTFDGDVISYFVNSLVSYLLKRKW